MLDKYLVRHCSPTLASLKIANLFTYKYICKDELNKQLNEWNESLKNRGIKLFVLKNKDNTALIYVYREKLLNQELKKNSIKLFLYRYGYNDFDIHTVLQKLKSRIINSKDFPHEIGVFLGYPLEDVIGFIENKGENSICVGCWKVYFNECEAIKVFTKYKRCTDLYVRLWNEGKSILQLTVAA